MGTNSDTRACLRSEVMLAAGVVIAGGAIGVGGQIYGMLASRRAIDATPSPTPEQLYVGVQISIDAWLVAGVVALFGAVMWYLAQKRLSRFDDLLLRSPAGEAQLGA
ncbi:MAG TPA: hypothetical protein VK843_13910 [Planctomycetota bacterium]|nr:hypothetical protein [Planctomycetota bacterium]